MALLVGCGAHPSSCDGSGSDASAEALDAQRLLDEVEAYLRERPRSHRPGDLTAQDAEAAERLLANAAAVDQYLRKTLWSISHQELSPQSRERLRFWLEERIELAGHAHARLVEGLLADLGVQWFDLGTFGPEVAADAWLLVQHADHDVAFQRRILARLEPLVARGQTDPQHYAGLHDRVSLAETGRQRYGTQGACAEEGGWQAAPLEDPEGVDGRRLALGLFPMAELQRAADAWCAEAGS